MDVREGKGVYFAFYEKIHCHGRTCNYATLGGILRADAYSKCNLHFLKIRKLLDEASVQLNNKATYKFLIAWKLPSTQLLGKKKTNKNPNNLTLSGSLSALYKQFQLSKERYSSLISSSSSLWDLLKVINQDTQREITVHELAIKYIK